MLRVFPEIEEPRSPPRDDRNIVRPIENGGEDVAIGGKTGIAEPRQGRRILRFDPGERPLAVDLFEPEIGVVVGSFDGRSRVGHGSALLSNEYGVKINTTSEYRYFAERSARF